MSIQEDWRDEERRKPGMSSGTKILIILLSVAGVLVLLCCGGLFFLGWKAQDMAQNMFKTDPAEVREATAEIAPIDVPPVFEPAMAMNVFNIMKIVQWRTREGDGELALAEFNQQFAEGQDPEAEMEDMLNQQGQNQTERNLETVNTETREFEIRGRTVAFEFAEAKEVGTDKEYRKVTGTFPTRVGMAALVVELPAEKYNEQEIVEMIESID